MLFVCTQQLPYAIGYSLQTLAKAMLFVFMLHISVNPVAAHLYSFLYDLFIVTINVIC